MKSLFIIAVITFSTTMGLAQQGKVSIEQDDRIIDLLDIYKSSNQEYEYYRIQVGFGSFDKAQRIKESVEIDFPDLFSKIDFDSPTYRVRLGRFKTKLQAERMFNEVRVKYPDAMLLKPKKST
ncbi:SPOR domain-containing protein [Maribacter arenosus]|uniref:SPOR domain-containing protein n=1 Tax=Maribacter arenosus TaxID=1854708 RepID=A0ABR7VFP6_9FLAO|nr:SPOR domain-containing protein [Maribacter arenosus]MBD0852469.1 SPOR domain-containing protein [Maribacter arenosus]